MGAPLATIAFLVALLVAGVVIADCAEKALRFFRLQRAERFLKGLDKRRR